MRTVVVSINKQFSKKNFYCSCPENNRNKQKFHNKILRNNNLTITFLYGVTDSKATVCRYTTTKRYTGKPNLQVIRVKLFSFETNLNFHFGLILLPYMVSIEVLDESSLSLSLFYCYFMKLYQFKYRWQVSLTDFKFVTSFSSYKDFYSAAQNEKT